MAIDLSVPMANHATPQARYNREVRRCPLIRQIEAERQRKRRRTPGYRAKAAAYVRRWRLAATDAD